MKKTGVKIAAFISTLCMLSAAAIAVAHLAEKDYIVEVNGSPVLAEEFQMLLKEHTIPYEMQLRELYGIPPERTVLEYLGGDQEEYRRLMCEENIKAITALRVEQALAQEYGLIPEFTYKRFLADLEEENRSRAEKLAAGEVVYGLQRFSVEQYYSYFMSNLRQELLRTLPDGLLGVSGERVDAYYRSLKTYAGVDGETIYYTLYDVTAAQALPAETQEGLCREIAETMAAGTYLDVETGGVACSPEKRTFTPDELRNFVRQDFNAEFLLGLAQGEICGPFSLGDHVYIAQYNGFDKAETLQDNDRDRFGNTLRKEAYGDLIAQKTEQANVKVNQKSMIEEEET